MSQKTDRFGNLTIALHWLMLLIIVAVYATMELRGAFPKGGEGRALMQVAHFSLGLTVLALVVVRIVARFAGNTPSIVPTPPAWQALLAKGVHLALYALMIGLPVLGWLILSAKAKPIPLFMLVLPPLIGADAVFAKTLKEIHEAAATAGYGLIGLHAIAAIYHHRFMRDNTMLRMLPKLG
jgi:superoxide oxidase